MRSLGLVVSLVFFSVTCSAFAQDEASKPWSESQVWLAVHGIDFSELDGLAATEREGTLARQWTTWHHLARAAMGLAPIEKHGAENGEGWVLARRYPERHEMHGALMMALHTKTDGRSESEASLNQWVDEYVKALGSVLKKIHEQSTSPLRQRLDQEHRQQEVCHHEARGLGQQLDAIRREGLDLHIIPDKLDQRLAQLMEEQHAIRVELAGLHAQRDAISKHLAVEQDRQAAKSGQTDVLRELERIVDLQTMQVKQRHAKMKQAVGSQAELVKAEMELAAAKADLAKHRAQFSQQSATSRTRRLNEQLSDVQIALAAAEAKSQVIEDAHSRFTSDKARALANQFDEVSRELALVLEDQKSAAKAVAEARRALNARPEPRVTVISRTPEPPKKAPHKKTPADGPGK